MELGNNLYTKAPGKRTVQSRVYESLGRTGNVTTLGGPSVGEVFKNTRKILGTDGTFTSYERVDWAFALHELWFRGLPDEDQARVSIVNDDIINAQATDIMEIDLEHGIEVEYPLIQQLFVKQRDDDTIKDKAFIFHVTARGRVGLSEGLVPRINDLLGTNIRIYSKSNLYDSSGNVSGRKYNLRGDFTDYSIELYTYRDNATMATVLIQY